MSHKKENPGRETELDDWIIEDLAKSGLTADNFEVEPLISEAELEEQLGVTKTKDISGNWIRILEIGGYWIPYPNVSGYYRLKLRREIQTQEGKVKYLSPKKELGKGNHAYILPEVEKLLKNYSPDKPIFITEGEKKAAKATLEGFPCIGLGGVWNFKDGDNNFLPQLDQYIWHNRTSYITYDSDITQKHNVRHAELRLATELINRRARSYSVRLPNESDGSKNGLDDFLVRYGAQAFRELIKDAIPTWERVIDGDMQTEQIIEEIGKLAYSPTREEFIGKIARVKKIPIDTIRGEVNKHLSKEGNKDEKQSVETFTPEELQKGLELLKLPDILVNMIDLTTRRGYVGEEINKKMLYLSFTSRLMSESISCIIKGESSSGKSSLVHTMIELFPREDILKFSFITPKALVHFPNDISHKILFLQERQGAEAGDYSIRTVLSEKELSILATIKDELSGAFRSEEKRIKADGLVYVETTTKERIHNENQTRLFDLFIDESTEQTARILKAEAEEIDREEIEKELRTWRALQWKLIPCQVIIPFSKALSDTFPVEKIRARRDFKRFLSLIKAHALLHQFQREQDNKNRIIATIEDLKAILPLSEVALLQSLKELSLRQEKVLTVIQEGFKDGSFSLGELRKKLNINARTLRRYLKEFERDGLLDWNGEKGKNSRYSLSNFPVPMSSMSDFAPNLLKSIENFEDKAKCLQTSSMSSRGSNHTRIEDDKDNRGQNNLSQINVNENRELDPKTPFEDMRTKDNSNVYAHIEGCNCEDCINSSADPWDIEGAEPC